MELVHLLDIQVQIFPSGVYTLLITQCVAQQTGTAKGISLIRYPLFDLVIPPIPLAENVL